ncbi:hypothetical protein [Mycobacterium sp. NAZ190054]|nr:hypothetical protein [Mycobacterium sp. NAZ190054]
MNALDRIHADARPATAFFSALTARDGAVCAEAERLDSWDADEWWLSR